MKVYVVMHSEDTGHYIGHGLYEQRTVTDCTFASLESAKKWIKEQTEKHHHFSDYYWIHVETVKD